MPRFGRNRRVTNPIIEENTADKKGADPTVVYLDLLLFLNLFVNFFLLLAVKAIHRLTVSFWRLLLGAFAGALFSLTLFLPELFFLTELLLNAAEAVVITGLAFSFRPLKRLLRLSGSFFGISFCFAGAMMAIWMLFKPPGMVIQNSVVYYNISPLLLVGSTLISYAAVRLFGLLLARRHPKKLMYRVTISLGGYTVSSEGFLDTGNSLRDLFSNTPVLIAEYSLIEPLLDREARRAFLTPASQWPNGLETRFRLIPYSAVGTQGFLASFRPDRVEICQTKNPKVYTQILVAVSPEPLQNGTPILLPSDLADELDDLDSRPQPQRPVLKKKAACTQAAASLKERIESSDETAE